MSNFASRLTDEKNQLDEKILKLDDFIKSNVFNDVDGVQRTLLKIQLSAMITYSQILDERLSILASSENTSV